MRKLDFFKLSPGGNTTVLLSGESLTAEEKLAAANEALHPLHLQGEQAGFVDLHAATLEMAGGEFCANAARSLGLLLALKAHARSGGQGRGRWSGVARVSGMEDPVRLEVSWEQTPADADAAVFLDLAPVPDCAVLGRGLTLVTLPGISHLLLDRAEHPFPQDDWQRQAAALRERFGLTRVPAAGCVWYSREGCALRADPVVWVRSLDFCCHETSCGSGALACALAEQAASGAALLPPGRALTVFQPSGQPLRVALKPKGGGVRARLGGPARLLAQGEVLLHSL